MTENFLSFVISSVENIVHFLPILHTYLKYSIYVGNSYTGILLTLFMSHSYRSISSPAAHKGWFSLYWLLRGVVTCGSSTMRRVFRSGRVICLKTLRDTISQICTSTKGQKHPNRNRKSLPKIMINNQMLVKISTRISSVGLELHKLETHDCYRNTRSFVWKPVLCLDFNPH